MGFSQPAGSEDMQNQERNNPYGLFLSHTPFVYAIRLFLISIYATPIRLMLKIIS